MDEKDLRFIKEMKSMKDGTYVLLSNFSHLGIDTKAELIANLPDYFDRSRTYVFPLDEQFNRRLYLGVNHLYTAMKARDFKVEETSTVEGINTDKVTCVGYDIPRLYSILNWRNQPVVYNSIRNKLESAPLENDSQFYEFEEVVRSLLLNIGIFDLNVYRELMLLYEKLFLLICKKHLEYFFGPAIDTESVVEGKNYRIGLDGMIAAEKRRDINSMIEMEMLFRSSFTKYEHMLELTDDGSKLYTLQCLSANKEFYSVNLTACLNKIYTTDYGEIAVKNAPWEVEKLILGKEEFISTNFRLESGLPEEIKSRILTLDIKSLVSEVVTRSEEFEGVSKEDIDLNIPENLLKALCYFIHRDSCSADETIFYEPAENIYVYRKNGNYMVLFVLKNEKEEVYAVSLDKARDLMLGFYDLKEIGDRIDFVY